MQLMDYPAKMIPESKINSLWPGEVIITLYMKVNTG